MVRARLAVVAALAALAAVALPAAGAHAATIQSPDAGIVLTAAPGEQNDVTLVASPTTGMLRLSERTVTLTAGFGCTQVDSRTADCTPRGQPVTIDLGDGGDMLEVPGALDARVVVRGGDGNDLLLAYGAATTGLDGGSGDDHLFGGLGADTLTGGPGTDDLRGDVVRDGRGGYVTSTTAGGDDMFAGGPDTDSYAGGLGADTVSYADAVAPVTAVLPRPSEEGGTTPGPGGEGEGLPPDVEGVIGGAGPDSLTGNRANNRLEGGPGNDTIKGNGGSDLLSGGGDGDTILARDATLDTISCGPNRTGKSPRRDTLDSDLADGPPPADCETVTQGALLEGANVHIAGKPRWPRRDGRVGIRLRCPKRVSIGCKGTLGLRLQAVGGRSAAAYRLAAGRSKLVLLPLSRAQKAAVRGASRSARLTSVEKGELGDKTTIRTVRLKRSG